ncbi:MAG: Gfo/Idh/MocA family oxidoreductase [Rhodospirillales bacterium]|nr:Gfo/Idh/MocA family oxidoreductase [Rhodospirillales bacterium]
MKINKVLFVGLGGAGQRHLRMFKAHLPGGVAFTAYRATGQTPALNNDFTVAEGVSLADEYGLSLFDNLDAALDDGPDLVVISNPTALHLGVMQKAAARGIGIFVEKPATHTLDGLDELEALVREKDLPFFVSFQRRFHPHLHRIKEMMETGALGKTLNAGFSVASYVPAWHPYEDFRQLYACRKDLGGGVLLTEIHEIDLCCWYFGPPQTVACTGGNYSDVAMDVEDTVHLTLGYTEFSVRIDLCFMQRHNQRRLFIAGTDGYVEWDQDGNRLLVEDYKSGQNESLEDPCFANDDMFTAQTRYFVDEFEPQGSGDYLDAARQSLVVVEAARQSMVSGTAVPLYKF